MNRSTLLLLLFIPLLSWSQKEPKNNMFSNANDAAKMALAKQKLYAGDFSGALSGYKEVEKNNPNNAVVAYYIGHCHFHLKQYEQAKSSLQKALEIKVDVKPETHVLLAEIYQMEENYDKALSELDGFKAAAAKATLDPEIQEEADLCSAQCMIAKALLTNPVNVSISNLGNEINSKYDDKNPCITADGKKMVFTTRRPETTNSEKDIEGDGGYFENIFIATYDSIQKKMIKAEAAGGSINSKAHDACTSISPDGKQIFIYKNDASKVESSGGNVFVSKINGDKWKAPVTLGKPINSSYWEGGACVSPDGKRYFFSSERKGGYGNSDIWMVEKVNKKDWGKPVNLGPEVNSSHDEAGMFLAPDAKTLFFCSNGAGSMGSYDIFKTVYENGKWSKPENLGFPINSSAKEGQLTLSADAKYAYISSNRKGGFGESDIYLIDLKNYSILEKDGKKKSSNGLSIVKGTIREGFEGFGMADVEVNVLNQNGAAVASTFTNENGEYFLTLPGGNYQLDIKKKGYQGVEEKFELPMDSPETFVLEKGYLLKK